MASDQTIEMFNEAQGRTPTIMYLIEIDSNIGSSSTGGVLPLQVLNINQNNTHYLIPIQGPDDTEPPKHIQNQQDLHTENVYTNESFVDDSSKKSADEQQIMRKTNAIVKTDVKKTTQMYVHIPDSVPPPRALASLPAALSFRRNGVSPVKLLPPHVRFGPVRGMVLQISTDDAAKLVSEAAASTKPVMLLSKDDTIYHIDVSDKDKSNWFSLLPLGDESTANVWLYQEGDELYAVTTRCVASRVRLCVGYSQQYATQHCLPSGQPVASIHCEEEQRRWWCYECRYSCKSASLLQRHMDESHMGCQSYSRKRRRYRCKNCALPFSRLFTLKRHMSLHCKGKSLKTDPQPEPEPAPEVTPNPTPPEDDRLPSDESFQNYTNSLDFSTNLFDTDRISTLDISANSRSDLNFYGDRDDSYLASLSGNGGNIVENAPVEPVYPRIENVEKVKATEATCPYCQETMSITLKQKHMRQCRARKLGVSCACGKVFSNRQLLAQHVLLAHGHAVPAVPAEEEGENESGASYECEQCYKVKFKRRGMLVNHMWRVHGVLAKVPLERRERHYPCGACPKVYRSAAKRDCHVRAHHPGVEVGRAAVIESGRVRCEPAACPSCPRQYATRAKLLQHVRERHGHLLNSPSAKSKIENEHLE